MGSQPAGTSESRVVAAVADYLDDLARRTHDRLGDVGGVAVTMAIADGGPVTAGASTQLVRSVDALQYAIEHGPCLNALAGHGGAYVPDLGADDRWGEYGPRAAALGVRSCLSVPVRAGDAPGAAAGEPDEVIAVAKVYALEVDGLDERQRRLGADLAAEVAAGLRLVRTLHDTAQELDDTTRELDDRVQAMNSRRPIDLAVGMLMERVGCDADRAYGFLRQFSQSRNVRLHEVAVELTRGDDTRSSSSVVVPEPSVYTELLAAAARELTPAPFLRRGTSPAR